LFLSPILEAESGCKGKATFSNFQIFLKKFSNFFSENVLLSFSFRSESGCKGKATFSNFQIFLKKSLIKFFKNHFLRSGSVSDLIAGAK
jgi:hypothetical protein